MAFPDVVFLASGVLIVGCIIVRVVIYYTAEKPARWVYSICDEIRRELGPGVPITPAMVSEWAKRREQVSGRWIAQPERQVR